MPDDTKCRYCFGTGQKVEMRPARWGEQLPPYERCPSCGGTGIAPKPVKVAR
jgi:DnaJ-class molecular chaperone